MSIPGNIKCWQPYGGPQDLKKNLKFTFLLGPHSLWPCTQKGSLLLELPSMNSTY